MKPFINKQLDNLKYDVAFVLGLDVNGIGHIRSLGAMGIKVYGIYTEKSDEALGRYSRCCVPILCSFGKDDHLRFKEKLISLTRGIPSKPVLFATSDYFVNFISEFRNELSNYFLFNIPDKRILDRIANKKSVGRLAEKAQIQTPETFTISKVNTLQTISKNLQYPCLIKPMDSFSVNFPGTSIIINNAIELEQFYCKNSIFIENTIIQEIIPGDECNIYQCTCYYNKDGHPLQLFTMQKIHQFPPDFGIAVLGRSIIKRDLLELTQHFLTKIGYTGFASVEYKWHSLEKKYYLIEINPRLPWYNSLFSSCGVNFPYIAYQDQKYSNKYIRLNNKQKVNCSWLYFRNDIAAYWKRKQKGEILNILKWFKPMFKARGFAYWSKSDPLPFFMAILDFLKWILKKIFIK
jgi:predicted ATP-grasp superfamily ATP-dependent carboligase